MTPARLLLGAAFIALMTFVQPASVSAADGAARPPSLAELQDVRATGRRADASQEIRGTALKEAALSLGMRGGLAYRTDEIGRQIENASGKLERIYDFRRIMIHGPGATMVIPGVVTEAEEAWIVSPDGSNVGAAERILKIQSRSKLTSAPPNWRQYLIRSWPKPDLPPDLLLPATAEEREQWRKWVALGWENGVLQAEDIFNADLARLERDFVGMTRYAVLVIEGLMDPPILALAERGVTGGGNSLKIGDRIIRITRQERLKGNAEDWAPALRAQE